jgi:hypothetical protein
MSGTKLDSTVISLGVSALLRDRGFARKGLVFRRAAPDDSGTHVVEVQVSRGSSAGQVQLVLNVGTYLPDVEALLHERKVKEPREYDCTLRTRIGAKARKNDPWWVVMPGKEAGVSALMVSALEERVLPWLLLTSDLTKLSRALDAAPSRDLWWPNMLTPAAVALALGKKTLAKKRVRAAEDSINATLAERAAQFGKNDPFGRDVLKLATRLRKEHAL